MILIVLSLKYFLLVFNFIHQILMSLDLTFGLFKMIQFAFDLLNLL